jgi:hypothetical protein
VKLESECGCQDIRYHGLLADPELDSRYGLGVGWMAVCEYELELSFPRTCHSHE